MTTAELIHMPLAACYLCCNEDAEGKRCDMVGNCSTACPACGNANLLSLANVLNREDEGTATL